MGIAGWEVRCEGGLGGAAKVRALPDGGRVQRMRARELALRVGRSEEIVHSVPSRGWCEAS